MTGPLLSWHQQAAGRTWIQAEKRLSPRGGQQIQLPVTSAGSSTTAVALNITAVNPGKNGFVTAWPCGTDRPTVSNLNPVAGVTRPNMANVRVGSNGAVCLYTMVDADLVVDLTARYVTGSGARYAAVAPARHALGGAPVLDVEQGRRRPARIGHCRTGEPDRHRHVGTWFHHRVLVSHVALAGHGQRQLHCERHVGQCCTASTDARLRMCAAVDPGTTRRGPVRHLALS